MELRVTRLVALIVCALLGACNSKYQTTGEERIFTRSACQYTTLEVSCSSGRIVVSNAFYGYNKTYSVDIKINCTGTTPDVSCVESTETTKKVSENCDQKPNCALDISTGLFNDPCSTSGVAKYITVNYMCDSSPDPTSYFSYDVTRDLEATFSVDGDDEDDTDSTLYPTYGVPTELSYSFSMEDGDNDEGSSLARFVPPVIGFVVFIVAGIIGILIKARRTMVREPDSIITSRFVQEKVDDIRETAVRLLPGKTEKQKKEDNEQQEV